MGGLFAPNSTNVAAGNHASLCKSLDQWEESLPSEMRVCGLKGSETLWTFLLHLAYKSVFRALVALPDR